MGKGRLDTQLNKRKEKEGNPLISNLSNLESPIADL
jgi:hypothetical protein